MRAMLILLAVFLLGGVAPASAQSYHHAFWDNAPAKPRKAKRQVRPRKVASHKATRVKAWRVPDPPKRDDTVPACLRFSIREQGNQGLTENSAEEKARDAWAAEVRSRIGEMHMDLRFAAHVKMRCWRSSVGDNPLKSLRERLRQRIGTIDDQASADKAAEYRCEIDAVPCVPVWQVVKP